MNETSRREHVIVNYSGGPQGVAPITAYCRCGVTATADQLDDVDRLVWDHVPPPPVPPVDVRAEAAAGALAAFPDDVWEARAAPYETDHGTDTVILLTLTVDQAERLVRDWESP